jgi:hypothetical protein
VHHWPFDICPGLGWGLLAFDGGKGRENASTERRLQNHRFKNLKRAGWSGLVCRELGDDVPVNAQFSRREIRILCGLFPADEQMGSVRSK